MTKYRIVCYFKTIDNIDVNQDVEIQYFENNNWLKDSIYHIEEFNEEKFLPEKILSRIYWFHTINRCKFDGIVYKKADN